MEPTIGLAMIVRDEEAIIGRCLDSVREHVDSWTICDTGSKDRTREIVREKLIAVPGELHEREWVNFGHNRSELLRLARGSADYLLLLDADMTVSVIGAPQLEADAYMLRFDEDPEYWLKCLVRSDIEWWSQGSTHEYLATSQFHTVENLREMVVHHHHDGSSRSAKLSRDRELLERDVSRDPENSRTAFYLAQTYRDQGERERAIRMYNRRAEMEGWDEEVFYAMHQKGLLLAQADKWPGAMASFLKAWEQRPSRIEPLYELASRLRARGEHQTAHMFAEKGLSRPKPGDHLFVERWIYEWGMRFEYSITAYWTGEVQAALRACDHLLDCPTLPPAHREQTVRNRQYCVRALSRTRKTRPSFTIDEDSTRVRVRLAPAGEDGFMLRS
jgi:glycosyltransferase involved in cell wall biosynthesis